MVASALVWLAVETGFQALPHLVASQEEPEPASLLFVPSETIMEEPFVMAEIRPSKNYVVLGEEFELALVVIYRKEEVRVSTSALRDVAMDPFEVKDVDIEEGILGRETKFKNGKKEDLSEIRILTVRYLVQCVRCIPGESHPLPSVPIELDIEGRGTVTQNVFPSRNTIPTVYLYNRELQSLRGMKTPEPISSYGVLPQILIGGGFMFVLTGIIGSAFFLLRRVVRRKKGPGNAALEAFASSLQGIEEKLSQGDGADCKPLFHELYRSVSIFVKKGRDIDVMREKERLEEGGNDASLRRIVDLCESAYSKSRSRKEELKSALSLARELARNKEGGGSDG